MSTLKQCPRCGNKKSWKVRRGKRKCSACRYEWRENGLPLHLSAAEWKKLLRWFLLGLSSRAISREANLGRADLSWANLTGADLREANLDGAKYNHTTEWPEDFNPT